MDQEIAAVVRAKYLLCAALAYYPIILAGVAGANLAHRSEVENPAVHWGQIFHLEVPDTNSSMCQVGRQPMDGGSFHDRDHEIKASRCWEPT